MHTNKERIQDILEKLIPETSLDGCYEIICKESNKRYDELSDQEHSWAKNIYATREFEKGRLVDLVDSNQVEEADIEHYLAGIFNLSLDLSVGKLMENPYSRVNFLAHITKDLPQVYFYCCLVARWKSFFTCSILKGATGLTPQSSANLLQSILIKSSGFNSHERTIPYNEEVLADFFEDVILLYQFAFEILNSPNPELHFIYTKPTIDTEIRYISYKLSSN